MRVEDEGGYLPYTTLGLRVLGFAPVVREDLQDLLASGIVVDGVQRISGGCADNVADSNCRSRR